MPAISTNSSNPNISNKAIADFVATHTPAEIAAKAAEVGVGLQQISSATGISVSTLSAGARDLGYTVVSSSTLSAGAGSQAINISAATTQTGPQPTVLTAGDYAAQQAAEKAAADKLAADKLAADQAAAGQQSAAGAGSASGQSLSSNVTGQVDGTSGNVSTQTGSTVDDFQKSQDANLRTQMKIAEMQQTFTLQSNLIDAQTNETKKVGDSIDSGSR